MTPNTHSQANFSASLKDNHQSLLETMRSAAKKIAPVWPLENFVAVNPYLGLANQSFDSVARELAVAGGVQMTLPVEFYLKKLEEGELKPEHLAIALKRKQLSISPEEFIKSLNNREAMEPSQLRAPGVAEVATRLTEQDWKRFVTARITNWAASYFDEGQAIWSAGHKELSPFLAWKKEAEQDFTPQLSGLKGFRKKVKALPNHPLEAARVALNILAIPEEGIDLYLHSLLLRLGGWSAYAARLDWDNELYGGEDGKLIEFLAVLLCWEACLLECTKHPELKGEWKAATKKLSTFHNQTGVIKQLTQNLILQEAFDVAVQSNIISKFKGTQLSPKNKRTQAKAQAIFCIDVRSEVFRRNLERVDMAIETMGFAGFFAFPIKFVPIGHEKGEAQCPVLLTTGPTIMEEMPQGEDQRNALKSRLLQRHVQQAWKSFKAGAVTCFSFVSPMGLSYLPKLFSDSFGWTRPVPHPEQVGLKKDQYNKRQVTLDEGIHSNEVTGIPIDQQIQMAKNALNAMSLREDFGRLVLIVGHGSSMVNNPHATGYDCGACGGHSGEANAKVAALVLNNRVVRAGLQHENIYIPVNTVFLACLHNTTTDEVTIYNQFDLTADRHEELQNLKWSLKMAGHATRAERSLRLAVDSKTSIYNAILTRSKDWSQTRPEWGLAGCSAFVVAPRERTRDIDLGGRSFLHSYNWKKDEGFGVLELIMTAPMVVTSWISLQYYASTVDNRVYGSGNKTLHNVTAGIGVLEGFSGDLRVGLPWQALHDGEQFQHDPVKLNVIIEAPIDAMNIILEKHQGVKDLCDNGWLNLLAMNEEGKVSHRYRGDFSWELVV